MPFPSLFFLYCSAIAPAGSGDGDTAGEPDGAQPAIFSSADGGAEQRAEKQTPPNGAYPL